MQRYAASPAVQLHMDESLEAFTERLNAARQTGAGTGEPAEDAATATRVPGERRP
jgi:hypothetical protein